MPEQSQEERHRNKKRVSLTLDETAIQQGEELAKEEKRSLSNLIEVLFEREHQRVFKASKEVSHAA